MTKNDVIRYWKSGANDAMEIANSLFKKKYYDNALFFGHLAIEKLLKAYVIERANRHPPHSHDLLYICGMAKIELDVNEQNMLKEVTTFNIAGRYPEEKLEFHKRIKRPYAAMWLKRINELYLWLKKLEREN